MTKVTFTVSKGNGNGLVRDRETGEVVVFNSWVLANTTAKALHGKVNAIYEERPWYMTK